MDNPVVQIAAVERGLRRLWLEHSLPPGGFASIIRDMPARCLESGIISYDSHVLLLVSTKVFNLWPPSCYLEKQPISARGRDDYADYSECPHSLHWT